MELDCNNFEKEILNYQGCALVDFWGSWCPPCKRIEGIMELLEEEYDGKIKIGSMNIDKSPYFSNKYNIKGVPTFIVFRDGKEVERHVGSKSKEQLKDIIDAAVK